MGFFLVTAFLPRLAGGAECAAVERQAGKQRPVAAAGSPRRRHGGGGPGGAPARPDPAGVRPARRRYRPGEGELGLPVPEEDGQPGAGPNGARARRRWVAGPERVRPRGGARFGVPGPAAAGPPPVEMAELWRSPCGVFLAVPLPAGAAFDAFF